LTRSHLNKFFFERKKKKKKKIQKKKKEKERNLICNKNSQSQGASALDFSQQEED
jgi:hypothetical protein